MQRYLLSPPGPLSRKRTRGSLVLVGGQRFLVCKPKKGQFQVFGQRRFTVPIPLFDVGQGMDAAVYLNGKSGVRAVEIQDVLSSWRLTIEAVSELSLTHDLPEPTLRRSHLAAQSPGNIRHLGTIAWSRLTFIGHRRENSPKIPLSPATQAQSRCRSLYQTPPRSLAREGAGG